MPVATWALIAANVAVFMGMLGDGASLLLVSGDYLVAYGGADAARIWQGEVWRLLTAVFVHGAVWHLGLNMWVLAQVGPVLERAVGASRFLLLYLVSGIFGFASSLLAHPGLTVGASGAIFGVVGGLFGLAMISRGKRISRVLIGALTPFVVITLVVGFLVPFVDNSAHIGGLVVGFLLGYGVLAEDAREAVEGLKRSAVLPASSAAGHDFGRAALAIVIASFMLVVPLSLRPVFSPHFAVTMGLSALLAQDRAAAELYAKKATELAPDDATVLIFTGRLRLDGGEADRAEGREFMLQGLKKLDDNPAVALETARMLLGGGPDPSRFTIVDERTTDTLCDLALELPGASSDPMLLNNCAWFWVKASSDALRAPERALELATRAADLVLKRGAGGTSALSSVEKAGAASVLHTRAEALAAAGDPEEARVVMDKVVVEGLSDLPFFKDERARFARLAERAAAKKGAPPPEAAESIPPGADGGAPLGGDAD